MRRIVTALLATSVGVLPAAAQKSHTVTANPDLTFSPAQLTITAGDSVTWRNEGGIHNVAADDGSFRCADGCDGAGGDGDPSETAWSFTLTFDQPSDVPYHCQVHGAPGGAGMSGLITVQAPPPPPPPPPPPEPPDDPPPEPADDGDGDDGEPGDGTPRPPRLPRRFDSGFEVEDFGDWDSRWCPSCELESGTLAAGGRITVGAARAAAAPQRYTGLLLGPEGADFDLYLLRRSGSRWTRTAGSATASAAEELRFVGAPGVYRWEVRAAAGEGSFVLLTESRAASAAAAGLHQTAAARYSGEQGVAWTQDGATREQDYLIDRLPAAARGYRVSFHINPQPGLILRRGMHHLLQLRGGGAQVLRVQLRAARGRDRGIELAVSVRAGGIWVGPGTVFVAFDAWKKISIDWVAGTPGEPNGFVEVRRGAEVVWRVDALDNASHRVDEVRFGQVTKGRKATRGSIHLDLFESSWVF